MYTLYNNPTPSSFASLITTYGTDDGSAVVLLHCLVACYTGLTCKPKKPLHRATHGPWEEEGKKRKRKIERKKKFEKSNGPQRNMQGISSQVKKQL